jgi:hypothetical protein
MKKLVVSLLLSVLVLSVFTAMTGCSGTIGTPVAGNGKLETKPFDYVGFNKLEIDTAFQVEVTKTDSFALGITADSNLFEFLDIRKSGNTLHIGLQKNHSYFNTTQKAMITMPDLRGLSVSGASKTHIIGFNSTNALDIEVSGASKLDITNVKTGNVILEVSGASHATGNLTMADGNFNISGASGVELEGTAGNITMDISGASSGKLDKFALVQAKMTVSGASSATINVSTKLDANVSGASRLYYIGSPTLGSINITGASTFSKKP